MDMTKVRKLVIYGSLASCSIFFSRAAPFQLVLAALGSEPHNPDLALQLWLLGFARAHKTRASAIRLSVPNRNPASAVHDPDIMLVNNPAFNDMGKSDKEILHIISGWLQKM
jgi:hypothetical protein